MGSKVAIMIADGTEPIEALTPYDVLTRGGCDVTLISAMESLTIKSSVGAKITADLLISDANLSEYDLLVVPGGSLGVQNLGKCQALTKELRNRMKADRLVGSICAGPMILNDLGLLEGRMAVCYPGCQAGFPQGTYQADLDVCVDGNLITATGPGTALPFALMLLHVIKGEAAAKQVAEDMLTQHGATAL